MQNYFAQIVVQELTDNLKTKVTVGSVEYKLFNRFSLHQLYIEDLNKDTLFCIEELDADFEFWNLFRSKVIFNSLALKNLSANLEINKNGEANFTFILDALKSPSSNEGSKLEYRIKEFRLVNSKLRYKNQKSLLSRSAALFNTNDMKFDSIQLHINLHLFRSDSLNLTINHLSAVEKSGLTLKNLTTSIEGSTHGATLPSLVLELPNSKLVLNAIELQYDSLADLRNIEEKLAWKVPIMNSYFSFQDLAAFVPEFSEVKGLATLKGNISGRISNLKFQNMEIKYGESIVLNTDVEISGLPKLEDAFVYGKINKLQFRKGDLQDLMANIQRRPVLLPKELTQMGLINYSGNVTGFFSDMVVYGILKTDIGSISTDILLKFKRQMKDLVYKGSIKSNSLDIARLLSAKNIGKVSFNLNTDGEKKESSDLKGIIKAVVSDFQLNKYNYKDITFKGKYDGNGFDGQLDIDDPNLQAQFSGLVDLRQEKPIIDLDLKVRNFDLYALHLIPNYPDAKLSFNGATKLVGNALENIDGYVLFDSIRFVNNNKTLHVNEIQIISRTQPNFTHLGISSDYVNGTITGNFKYNSIGKSIHKIIESYLPSLATDNPNVSGDYQNHFDLDLRLSNTQEISQVLDLPFSIVGVSLVRGSIDEKSNQIDLIAICPSLKITNLNFNDISVDIKNPNGKLQLKSRGVLIQKDGSTEIFLNASAQNNAMSTLIGWQNTQKIINAGEFQTLTHFSKALGKTASRISIFPTQLIINDSTWNIRPSRIQLKPDSTIHVANFKIDNTNQFIFINGIASKNKEDALKINMNEMNLSFIMDLLKLKGITIGGEASGEVTMYSLLKQPYFEADLSVKHPTLNAKEIAHNIAINSTWDNYEKLVMLKANFFDNKSQLLANADGIFSPSADSIDVTYDTKKISIEFLQPYFESVAQQVKGFGSGKLRMFGPMKKIHFEGDIHVDKGQASIKMLGTKYFFNDTIRLTTKKIEIRNSKIFDEDKNFGFIQGDIHHNGLFQEMNYDIRMRSKNILALNTKATDNAYFYGKAYADGTVRISGNDKEATILVNAVSQPKTKCYIQMGGASSATDNSFINFVNTKEDIPKKNNKPNVLGGFNTKVNLQIDVNQNADMELIVSPKEGDMIAGRGNGNLRVQFDTFSDINLFGTYTIDNGFYLFTLQNVIRKEFKIDRGSTLAWTGDPFNAQVNIRALYPVTASLRDLMEESELSQNNSTTVPVNCVLKLTDNLMKPNIVFDVDLPTSEASIKQRVKSIINTDQMMNQQIVSLLVMSRFYKPDYLRSASSNSNFANNEGVSFLTTTLSSQLNRWIQQSLNSSNLSFGLDMNATDLNSEYKAQVYYQPSSRLIVNGDFGYRNDNLNTTNTNRFIGDVDIEYLLTESGKYRFKAYNHSVDRYQLRSARTTQGIGLMYKEDFETIHDMFRYYWKALTTFGQKKDEKDTLQLEP